MENHATLALEKKDLYPLYEEFQNIFFNTLNVLKALKNLSELEKDQELVNSTVVDWVRIKSLLLSLKKEAQKQEREDLYHCLSFLEEELKNFSCFEYNEDQIDLLSKYTKEMSHYL